jgi:hypothetical protein
MPLPLTSPITSRSAAGEEATVQVKRVRFRIDDTRIGCKMARQLHLHRSNDRRCDLFLKLKDRCETALVFAGPDMAAVSHVHELRVDAQSVILAAHAAFKHGVDTQDRANSANVVGAPFELEGTRARDNLESRHAGERGDEFVGQAVGEALIIRIRAQACERQHDNASCERRLRALIGAQEFRRVGSSWENNAHGLAGAVSLVIPIELLSKAREFNPHDRIGVRVVTGFAPKDRHSQHRFFQRVNASGECLGNGMPEQLAQPRRIGESSA